MVADRPDQYRVVGNPIAHSKSPRIHGLFAAQTGQNLEYRTCLIERDGFPQAIDEFRAAGGRGINITVPFKSDAYTYADLLSERSQRAGAVNTLLFDSRGAVADNTDGLGLVRDLAVNHGLELADLRVLLLGAGGAARGALQPLLEQRPATVTIANRTAEKAFTLAAEFEDLGPVAACSLPQLQGSRFDLIINATAASLDRALPPLPDDVLEPGGWCYDMMYSDEPTVFLRWAQAHGAAKTLDGIGMLVEQAAESFLIWRGVRPDTAPVMTALRPT